MALHTTSGKPVSTVIQTPSTDSITHHIVGQHTSLSGLTPITVVSQGNNQVILAQAGKMISAPILKSVGQVPIAQYLNSTTLMKPMVVVTTPTTSSTAIQTSSQQQTLTATASNTTVVTTASQQQSKM